MPSDSYYDPPEPTHEPGECKACGQEAEVNVLTRYCDPCAEAGASDDHDAKVDSMRDEGRLR